MESIQEKKIVYHKITQLFATFTDAIDFLGRIAWPIIDVIFRFWMAKQLLISAILLSTHWNTAITLAVSEYPVFWLSPKWETLLGISAQFIGGSSFLLGLGTRVGALVILILALMTQIYYIAIDVNLFWIALALGYFLRGPGPFSLDHLLSKGLRRSPLSFLIGITIFFNKNEAWLATIYLLVLRIWLMLTFLLAAYGKETGMETIGSFPLWLPVHSAWLNFKAFSLFMAVFLGFGFATRLVALVSLIIIYVNHVTVGGESYYVYWMITMLILLVSGPGNSSFDEYIFQFLKKRYPELSGKPAFDLEKLPHIVIIGAGFGGIACAKALRHSAVKITLIDRHNYHLFQPLLYQVATGSLSPGDIAVSIRSIFLRQFNVDVVLGEVTTIDKIARTVAVNNRQISYDYLVLATGSTHSYFGHDNWEKYAAGLKTIEDATLIRSQIIRMLELAESASSVEEQHQLMNFVIVGGGPTGVELAGAIAELAYFGMEKNFRHIDPSTTTITLVQAASRLLPAFSEEISVKARASLEEIGVKVFTNSVVEKIDDEGVIVNGKRISSKLVLWAAGVTASSAAKWLDADADSAGRVKVTSNLSVPNYAEIFVIGDTAASTTWNGKLVPGIAPAAKQAGVYVAKVLAHKISNKPFGKAFKYRHLGNLATIGRKSAVAEINNFKISGETAWWFWGIVHVFFLVGSRNRFSVLSNWVWSYLTLRANNLLITNASPKRVLINSTKNE